MAAARGKAETYGQSNGRQAGSSRHPGPRASRGQAHNGPFARGRRIPGMWTHVNPTENRATVRSRFSGFFAGSAWAAPGRLRRAPRMGSLSGPARAALPGVSTVLPGGHGPPTLLRTVEAAVPPNRGDRVETLPRPHPVTHAVQQTPREVFQTTKPRPHGAAGVRRQPPQAPPGQQLHQDKGAGKCELDGAGAMARLTQRDLARFDLSAHHSRVCT